MAKKITELVELTAVATNDLFVVDDVSASTTKKITWDNLVANNSVSASKVQFSTFTSAVLARTYYRAYHGTNQSRSLSTFAAVTVATASTGSLSITTTGKDLMVQAFMPVFMTSGTGRVGVRLNAVEYDLASVTATATITAGGFVIIPGSTLPAGTYAFEFIQAGSGAANINLLAFSSSVLSAHELPSMN